MGPLPDVARGVGVDIPTGGHLISAYALGARLPRRRLARDSWRRSCSAARSPRSPRSPRLRFAAARPGS